MFCINSLFLVFCWLLKENCAFKGKNAKFGKKLKKEPSKEVRLSTQPYAQAHMHSSLVGLRLRAIMPISKHQRMSVAPQEEHRMHQCD
jgi:hypothetical protein